MSNQSSSHRDLIEGRPSYPVAESFFVILAVLATVSLAYAIGYVKAKVDPNVWTRLSELKKKQLADCLQQRSYSECVENKSIIDTKFSELALQTSQIDVQPWYLSLAAASLAVTLFGVILVARTLSVNRLLIAESRNATEAMKDANAISNLIRIHECRPFLRIDRFEIVAIKSDVVEIKAEIRNFGRGLAIDPKIHGIKYYANSDFSEFRHFSKHTHKFSNIPPNGRTWFSLKMPRNQDLIAAIERYEVHKIIRTVLEFRSEVGDVYYTKRRLSLGNVVEVGEELKAMDEDDIDFFVGATANGIIDANVFANLSF